MSDAPPPLPPSGGPQPSEPVRHVVDGPSDVLVVCHANITRSPLMAAMLADRWTRKFGVTIGSAGVRAMVGSGADEGSIHEAEVRRLALDHHVSRQVTPELIRGARLVLTMTEKQRGECRHLVPESAAYVFTVPEAARLARHVGPIGMRAGPDGLARWWHDARPMADRARQPEDVADPHGGPMEGFVRLGMALDQHVAAITAG